MGEEVGGGKAVATLSKAFSPVPLSEDWPCSRPSPPATFGEGEEEVVGGVVAGVVGGSGLADEVAEFGEEAGA